MKHRGFTLVELVIAIALLGIVSVTISSRWFSTDAFHADTLAEQLLSSARLAQRTALSNSQMTVSLVVRESGNDWQYQIFQDDGSGPTLMREISADTGGVGIQVTAGASQTLGAGTNLDVTFDALGNVSQVTVGGVVRDASSGVRVTLQNHALCISPLGYAHEGNCV